MIIRTVYYIILSIFLTGCMVGPKYSPPMVKAPVDWKNDTVQKEPGCLVDYWWQIFNEEPLDRLERLAVKNNYDIKVSIQRLKASKALTCKSNADLYPQLSLDPNYLNYLALLYFPIPGPGVQDTKRIHMFNYEIPLNVSWELDIWGKLENNYRAAFVDSQSKQAALCQVILSITTDLALSYYSLKGYDSEIKLLEEQIIVDAEELNLTQVQFNKGLISYLDITYAEQNLYNDQALLEESKRLRALEENKIALLIGLPASCLHLSASLLEDNPPTIPSGIPSTILLKRPDIRQTERIAASLHYKANSAYASFFPSIELTGTLGYLSPFLEYFLTWASRYWAVGTNIHEVIFDGGRLSANLEMAVAQFNEASFEYKQTVLNAFKEVEDSLNNIEKSDKRYQKLDLALKAAKETSRITKARYDKGLTSYFEYFNAKKSEIKTATYTNSALAFRYQSRIQLIKSLGGSFNEKVSSVNSIIKASSKDEPQK